MKQTFVHPQALCESTDIGAGTRVWAFAHVLPGARIGADCNICDGVFVENDVVLGDRVTVKCGVQIWDGITIEDDVFIGPNATFTNDAFPRSKVYPEKPTRTLVRSGVSIGANSTILPGVEIGTGAMVGAAAVVTRSVPPNAIVVGNPARIKGYVAGGEHLGTPFAGGGTRQTGKVGLGVGAASLHELHVTKDLRGELSVGEFERELPFVPKRYFLVFNVPSMEVRGEHAHRSCEQFLICVRGSCGVLLDDGHNRREVTLDRPSRGVYMPAMIWGTQYRYSPDALLLVFASDYYDPDDYIRSYEEFQRIVSRQAARA
ncbi:WxcM-like domain-containing protein [Microtetraspora sp. AC03309]|uniref:WxcM-like domain-containing protein n=1 Tax=Microtetraspora sp. AC03309 TaxID=2779376 RepID=UPI00272E2492|nr:WxcM-like domain-containing protein [Microtetraspora sp. AC03309]MCC5577026.1 WxcM-like domain-containing protein [Microtetraspora sp. AC03309]